MINNIENKIDNVIKHEYFVAIMIVFIILYHSTIGFKLPKFMLSFVNNPIFTFIILVLIAFIFAYDKKI